MRQKCSLPYPDLIHFFSYSYIGLSIERQWSTNFFFFFFFFFLGGGGVKNKRHDY